MDSLQGRPRAESIKTIEELRKWTLDARQTIVERFAAGTTRENLAAKQWLTQHGNRVPLLLDATDYDSPRLSEPYAPHYQDYVAIANALLAWCDRQKPTPNPIGSGRGLTTNELMEAKLASDLETVKGWTAQKWADHLGRAKSTVIGTKTWESLTLLRQQAKAEKKRDRRGTKPV